MPQLGSSFLSLTRVVVPRVIRGETELAPSFLPKTESLGNLLASGGGGLGGESQDE